MATQTTTRTIQVSTFVLYAPRKTWNLQIIEREEKNGYALWLFKIGKSGVYSFFQEYENAIANAINIATEKGEKQIKQMKPATTPYISK